MIGVCHKETEGSFAYRREFRMRGRIVVPVAIVVLSAVVPNGVLASSVRYTPLHEAVIEKQVRKSFAVCALARPAHGKWARTREPASRLLLWNGAV